MKLKLIAFSLLVFNIANAQPIELKLRVVHGPSSIVSKPLMQFKKDVEKQTQNRVKIKLIKPQTEEDNELQAAGEAYKELKAGTLDISQVHAFFLGQDVSDFNVLDRPFTFENHAQAFEVVDGTIGQELFQKLNDKVAVTGLAYTYSGGYRFVATKTKKIQTVDDFKNLELARRMSPADYTLMTALGVKIKKNEKRFGKDGRVTVYSTYRGSKEEKKTPIVNAVNFGLQFTALIISEKSLSQLSKEDQEILKTAALRAAKQERTLAIKAQTEIETKFAKRKLQYVHFPESERLKLKEFSDKMDWSSLKLTEGLLERIQKTVVPPQANN